MLITTLKIPFLSSPAIFFCLNVIYWADGVSTFLINIADLFIRHQISNKTIILAYFGYFLDWSRLHLTRARETKITKIDLATCLIGGISTRNVSI